MEKGECLYIVIPAYNERKRSSRSRQNGMPFWKSACGGGCSENSRLLIIDDGSRDNTYARLTALKNKLAYLQLVTKPNEGHGATLLFGYHYALEHGASQVFQTDSDGQTLPREFLPFWADRGENRALIGYRKNRQDGISRVFVTKCLKLVLWTIFHINVTDANTPFRLMGAPLLRKYIDKIPEKFNLSNVMLTVLFMNGEEDVQFLPITFRPRQGGKNSINMPEIIRIGVQAVKDFSAIQKSLKAGELV